MRKKRILHYVLDVEPGMKDQYATEKNRRIGTRKNTVEEKAASKTVHSIHARYESLPFPK